jgi:hypothetical protein
MSFASRLSLALPLLAAVAMTSAGNAATTCSEGGKSWKNLLEPAMHSRVLALSRNCPLDCRTHVQGSSSIGSEREAHAPLPLSVVTRAEDVADWHADIFEQLRGERFDDGLVRYCGITPSTRQKPL